MPLNHLYGPHTIIGNLNRTEIWLTAFACCNWLILMLFNPVFAVVQLPIYIFTISHCSSIGIHSNEPMKINFYHCQISSWSKPGITLVEIQQNILTWSLHAMQIWEMFKENAGFCSKMQKRIYRGCCSVQDWLADFFVIIKVFGRQNNIIPEK